MIFIHHILKRNEDVVKARESPAAFLVCEKQTLDHKLLNELAAVRILDGGVS